jgi:hypothetical protein
MQKVARKYVAAFVTASDGKRKVKLKSGILP